MTYLELIAEHDAIDALAQQLVRVARATEPRSEVAAHFLEELARLVRDHLAGEDPMIYDVLDAVKGHRHQLTAEEFAAELTALKAEWAAYLDRWTPAALDAHWEGFASASEAMLERLRERVTRETSILYSLALHLDVIAPGPSSARRNGGNSTVSS